LFLHNSRTPAALNRTQAVSYQTIRRRINDGIIPAKKFGPKPRASIVASGSLINAWRLDPDGVYRIVNLGSIGGR
jgi:hypothetical protein